MNKVGPTNPWWPAIRGTFTVLVTILIANQVSSVAAEPYDLRGIRLGLTLSEFRQAKFPDSDQYPNAKVECSTDSGANAVLGVFGPDSKIGVIKCDWYDHNGLPISLNLANAYVNTRAFYFASATAGTEARLYKIVFEHDPNYFSVFAAAYTQKFGPPKAKSNRPVQNRLGATFENWVYEWRNAESSIVIEQRSASADVMNITYTHTELSKAINQRRRAVEGKPSDKL